MQDSGKRKIEVPWSVFGVHETMLLLLLVLLLLLNGRGNMVIAAVVVVIGYKNWRSADFTRAS